MTRRDRCHVTAVRAAKLTPAQAAHAWSALAQSVECMGELDVPKFNQLLAAFRSATLAGKKVAPGGAQGTAPFPTQPPVT